MIIVRKRARFIWIVPLLMLMTVDSLETYAQNDTSNFWIVKAYPVFTGISPNGAVLGVEKTIDSARFGAYAGLKYFGGTTVVLGSSGEVVKPAYWRLELQGRYYPGTIEKVMYIGPFVNLNSEWEVAGGLLIGAQPIFWNKIPLDINIGFQSNTPTDNFESPLFLRFNIGVGIALKAN